MRQPFIAGNWKMNGSRESVDYLLKSIKARSSDLSQVELAVFPPFIFLEKTSAVLCDSPVKWGAQNVSHASDGAFTGEISASMLLDFCCHYVIVGHSERRTLYKEGDSVIAKKFIAALEVGLRPVLCVGESLEQRERGETLSVISEQLDAVLSLTKNHPALLTSVVAYEPVWAIGTGKQATPEQAQEVHEAIRSQCGAVNADLADQVRIIYGGSVKSSHSKDLLKMPDIDGALVGGASLCADEFMEIALSV